MKYKVKHDGITKTYAWLRHTAHHLLDSAKENPSGALLNLQAAAVFCAFTFEAYLNHVGAEEIPFWEEIDRISHAKKLRVIARQLNLRLDFGTPPFQVIRELFDLRNSLAHCRTQSIELTYETDSEPDHMSTWRLHDWEKLTPEKVDHYFSCVTDAIETLDRSRPQPDDMLWNQGNRGRSVEMVE